MGKVLIIDDENQLRGLLARIIGLEGYEVIQADSCKAGLKQVEQQNPDVIICDVRLPDGSGVDLITEMKRLGPLTEIIRPWEYPGWSTSDKKRCIRLYNQRRRQ